MTDDRTDAATVTWTTARGTKRRIVFEPQSDGTYIRHTEYYEDGAWQPSGGEMVKHVDIEAPENSDFLSLFPRSQTDA